MPEINLMGDFANILYETHGSLALAVINRTSRFNAISLDTLQELHKALTQAETDPSISSFAITGAGDKAFASGSELSEVEKRDMVKALEPIVQGFAERLERSSLPTIAAINGYCFGGGLEVALGCDLRIGTYSAQFATPEGSLGIIPGGGATQRLPRIIGRAWGMEMLLMGETMDAERALQVGLITRLVDQKELMPALIEMSERIESYAPLVPRFMKMMVNYGMESSQLSALMLEKIAQAALCSTEDKKEGLRAFLEKRKPHWKGQ